MTGLGINYLAANKGKRGLALALFTWLMLLAATIVMAVLFGTTLNAAVLYAGYMAFFVILPGSLLLGLAARRELSPIGFAAIAVVVGQCVEMAIGMLATALRLQEFYLFLPLLYFVAIWFTRQQV